MLNDNYEKNKESVECEDEKDETKTNPKKCTIIFSELTKLEYNFVDKDDYTMFPEKIIVYNRNKITGNWTLTTNLTYLNFKPLFDEEPIVSSNLPIGLGECAVLCNDLIFN